MRGEKRTQLSICSGKWLPQQGWQAMVGSRQKVSHKQFTLRIVFSECTQTVRGFPGMGMTIVHATCFRTVYDSTSTRDVFIGLCSFATGIAAEV